jgi:hypothetical protein
VPSRPIASGSRRLPRRLSVTLTLMSAASPGKLSNNLAFRASRSAAAEPCVGRFGRVERGPDDLGPGPTANNLAPTTRRQQAAERAGRPHLGHSGRIRAGVRNFQSSGVLWAADMTRYGNQDKRSSSGIRPAQPAPNVTMTKRSAGQRWCAEACHDLVLQPHLSFASLVVCAPSASLVASSPS